MIVERPLVPVFAGDAVAVGDLLDRQVDLLRHLGHDDIVELLERMDAEPTL